ncbi:MAG TPA: helix-turn-helix domain-containing protein [Thermotogota bacterium]|nr:helix-turn-helix domain-containing protein [Thermotogota bacterium]
MTKKSIEHVFKQTGDQLKKARIAKGLSKEKVFERTHISVETIEEIEKGELTDVPTIYLRDFIIRYSTFLGNRNQGIIEEFLLLLDQKGQKIPKINKRTEGKKPVGLILQIMIPFLVGILFFQSWLIQKQHARELCKITNMGNTPVAIQTGGGQISLNPNQTISFGDTVKCRVINTEKSLIVVEYYEDTWEVFFKEFEVLIKNGQDS